MVSIALTFCDYDTARSEIQGQKKTWSLNAKNLK
jgi:hypothetical protein